MDRKSLLVAVGGGVVGDIAGFLAGTYLRGIRWINLPTTLLAQVDSSVGGKTGVNHPMGKNLIGVFHQPSLVACDIQSLRTLPFRERVCGFGEMIKHGLAFDPGYFRFLSRHQDSILAGDRKHLSEAVANSVQWKARIVAQDPLEKKGKRILLNLGHTVGHALEGATHYEHFRHGEAVIWGMRAAALLSREQGHLRNSAQAEIDLALAKIPVPPVPRLSFRKILSFLRHDKKSSRGKVSFVLLSAIGKTTIDREVPPDSIRKALLELGVKLSP